MVWPSSLTYAAGDIASSIFDEEEPLDEQTAEFESVAKELYNQAPDSTTGLTALRDLYSTYEFPDKERASGIFSSYSDDVRKRFGETEAFDYDTTMGLALVDMIDITPDETDDPEDAKLDTILKWEEENLKALAETDDPRYIQARSQLERGIKQASVMQQREFYGSENYLVDMGVRGAQGLIGPIADAVGADSVSDFFTKRANQDNDDDYWAAIASGAGSAVGAVGAGIATTVTTGSPWGAAAYLGASGVGAVRNQVESSLENEGTAGEAAAAGAIETVSQAVQVVPGTKVFGGVAKQIGGRFTSTLGARVYPKGSEIASRIAGAVALESAAEGTGQVISNIAENVGQGDVWNEDLGRGVPQAFVAGGVVGGVAKAGGEFAESRTKSREGDTLEDIPVVSPEGRSQDAELLDLSNAIEEIDGSPPPPREAVPAPRQSVTLNTEPTTVASLSDGTELVEADGRIHLQAGGKTLQAYDSVHFVEPEIAELLRDGTNGHGPDGTAVTLTTDADGNLFLESEFLNEDLTVGRKKTQVSRRVVPTKDTAEGSAIVFADKTRTGNGVRENGYFITAGKVDATNDGAMGAARVAGKESQFLKKLRTTFGEEDLLKRGLLTETENGNVSLFTYFPKGNEEQADDANAYIAKHGIPYSIDRIRGLIRFNREDANIAHALNMKFQKAIWDAEAIKDYDSSGELTEIHTDILLALERIGGDEGAGGTLQTFAQAAQNKIAGRTVGDFHVLRINQDLRKKGFEELEKDPDFEGQKISLPTLNQEVKAANEDVVAIEKEAKAPEIKALADLQVEIDDISNKQKRKEIDEPIEKFTKEIETLKRDIEDETGDFKNQLSETDRQLKDVIDDTGKTISDIEQDIAERAARNKAPTSAQTKKLNSLKSRLTNLNNQFKDVKTQDPKKSNAVQKLRSRIAQRHKAIRDLKKQSKTPRELTPRQQQLVKKKTEIETASKEGLIIIDPDVTKRLVSAKNKQRRAQAKLAKAEAKLQEKLAQFDPQDQANLRNWYNLLNDVPEGEVKRKIQNAIFNVESKYLPPNSPFKIDNIFSFWRKNILSGPITQVRNIIGNATLAASNVAGTAVTGVPRGSADFVAYAGGWIKGLADGRTEMTEILLGNRSGRMTLGMSGEFTPSKLSLKNPFSAITEMMQRFMSMADSAFFRGAESGQAYLVEYIAAEKQKVPIAQRKEWVENRLYNTKNKVAKITEEVESYAETLKEAGIKMSPREKQLAIFERAQSLRDETTRAIAARHGEKSVFLQEPEGYIGALARGLSSTSKDEEASVNIAGKKVYPLKHLFPFVRTIANVSNTFIDHSPLGFYGAKKAGKKAVQIKGKDVKLSDDSTVSNALEARQLAGQALIGSALMGGLFSVAMAFNDDEDPFIAFYGNVPRGKWKEWQEKGIIPYSMKIGDSYIGLQNTPLALVAAVIGGGMQGVKNGGNPATIGANAALASVGAVADLSFIRSAGELFNLLTGSKTDSFTDGSSKGTKTASNAIKGQVANFASGFIPASGFLKNIGRWMEASPTETYNNFSAKMFGQLPFSRDLGVGKPKLNIFGEPLTLDIWKRSGMSSFLSYKTTDPALLWMQESGHSITDPGPILKLGKAEEKRYGALQESRVDYRDILDEEQSRQVLEISGPQIKQYLQRISRDPNYQTATERTQSRINAQVSMYRARAKLQVLQGR